MRYLILCVFLSFFLSACSDDDAPTEELEQHGILGNWILVDTYTYELGSPTVIDDLAVDIGSLQFSPDENLDDLAGLFEKTESVGGLSTGTFTLVPSDSTTLFRLDDEQLLVDYEMKGDDLTISRLDDTTVLVEGYNKE